MATAKPKGPVKRASRRHVGWQLDYGNGPRGKVITDYATAKWFAASERAILHNPKVRVVKATYRP